MRSVKITLSARDKREIKKTEEIIKILNGSTVIEAKHILAAVSNHLDSSSVIDKKQFELNIKPLFKNF